MSTAPFATAAKYSAPAGLQPRPIGPRDPMPFGKHKGLEIDQVPADYLRWALGNMDCCDPDHDRYWPEFTAVLTDIVGSQTPLLRKPQAISLPALCALLAGRGITISAKQGELVTSELVTDEEIREGLRIHRAGLLQIVKLVTPSQASGNGSAKLLWAADLRCRVKAWYGRMSRQFHPDSGGSPEKQTAVNQCYRSLMEVLQEWESKP
jgi:hypothetical protein